MLHIMLTYKNESTALTNTSYYKEWNQQNLFILSWNLLYPSRHVYAGICYVQPTYQIWNVYNYLQRRYERQCL